MSQALKRPCSACPWKLDSPRGWLGASTPVEFLQQSESELRMPCHLHVDYDRADWPAQADRAPQCAGRAIHFANRCKLPRNLDLVLARPDRESVFSNPQDFIDHHTLGGHAPKINIALGMVRVIEDEA